MTRLLLLALLFLSAAAAWAQTTEPVDTLPAITVGLGSAWTRGDVHSVSADINIAVRAGNTPVLWWSTISTPVAVVPKGAPPLVSTATTGISYIVGRSPGGRVLLVINGQGGVNTVQATGNVSLAVTGSAGVAFRLSKKRDLYLMPFARASKPQRGTDGNLVSAILQPAAMLIFGFGGK